MWRAQQFNEVVVLLLCIVRAASPIEKNKSTEFSSEKEDSGLSTDLGGQSFESMPMCTSRKRFINPDDLIKLSNELIEFDENFLQSIEVEVCENEGSPCFDEDKVLENTSCVQKHLAVQLQVVTRNSTKTEAKTFSIPSNCDCVYLKREL